MSPRPFPRLARIYTTKNHVIASQRDARGEMLAFLATIPVRRDPCLPVLTLAWCTPCGCNPSLLGRPRCMPCGYVRPYRCNPGSSSQAALRTVPRPGMDLVPDVHSVRYPRKRSHALQNVARVWRPFLFGVQEPFLFSRKTEKRNGSCFTQVGHNKHAAATSLIPNT